MILQLPPRSLFLICKMVTAHFLPILFFFFRSVKRTIRSFLESWNPRLLLLLFLWSPPPPPASPPPFYHLGSNRDDDSVRPFGSFFDSSGMYLPSNLRFVHFFFSFFPHGLSVMWYHGQAINFFFFPKRLIRFPAPDGTSSPYFSPPQTGVVVCKV